MAERASSKQYLVVDESGKGHLPVRDTPEGPLNHHLMGAAWAALHGGYRGKKYEGPGKEAALEKLKALYRSEGIDLPDAQAAERSVVRGPSSVARATGSVVENNGQRTRDNGPHLVALLADPGEGGLIRIPIAITGKWKGAEQEFTIDLEDLREIRSNFAKKATGEINVDYEHASESPFGTGGPVLSAGRIVKLDEPEEYGARDSGLGVGEKPQSAAPSPQPRFILWGWYEPTERARTLIRAREYRFISPAIRWGAKDKKTGRVQGTTLTSVALVNKPFLEEMPQIQEPGARSQESGDGSSLVTHHSSLFSETVGDQKLFVSLGQLHVPGPVNQVSVAYRQPEKDSGSRIQDSGPESRISEMRSPKGSAGVQTSNLNLQSLESDGLHRSPGIGPESLSAKENAMATKSLKLKCLTAADLEKHGLPESHQGKIGVFEGEEYIGTAEPPEDWQSPAAGVAEGEEKSMKASEVFAAEVGLPGKSLAEIAALVKRGEEARTDQFAALSEAIHEGRLDILEAGRLADSGKVRFSTILEAQEAERKVEAAVKTGKVLPKNRAHALKLALSDSAAFAALVEQGPAAVDLRTHGHPGGGEQPTAQQTLMGEVNAYAKENKCSVSVALSEVTKRQPELWRAYSEEIVTAVKAEAAEEE